MDFLGLGIKGKNCSKIEKQFLNLIIDMLKLTKYRLSSGRYPVF